LDWLSENVHLPHSARNDRFDRTLAPWLNRPLEETEKDTNDEIVVCAPVGSGKTTFFELLLLFAVFFLNVMRQNNNNPYYIY
jgi:replicative superfamily II helicase